MPLTVLNVSYSLARISGNTAGGAEQVLAIIDEALVRAGHRSVVVAPAGSHCRGLLLATPPLPSSLDEHAQQLGREEHRHAVVQALKRFQIDVVHLHGVDFLDYLPPAGIPVVVTLHLPLDWYPRELFHVGRPETYLVCVSSSQARLRPSEARMLTVIENGIPLHEFGSGRSKGNYALAMGRICPEKGFHLAMDACSRAQIPFFLAGTVFGYPAHRTYFEQSILPRLSDTQHLLGSIGGQRKRHLLAGAKCVLIPSLAMETSSLVAMEAMACGTPVVAFRSGALCELIRDGHTGFLVNSVEEMAEAMAATCSLDSRRCRTEAEQRFSAEHMSTNYLRFYEDIAKGASRQSSTMRTVEAT
jgi:glycosyltransferase involved in cell wall biosynthesis